ncbi:MAG: zinc ribbon domain-containing protein [Pirellulales bacterium]
MADLRPLKPPRSKRGPPDLAKAPLLQGTVCEACGSPVDARDKFCHACGLPRASSSPPPIPVGMHAPVAPTQVPADRRYDEPRLTNIECKNCGSTIKLEAGQRSYVCPFCESTYVVELPEDDGRMRPEFVVGFGLTPQQAWEKFQVWLRRGSWWRPLDLNKVVSEDRLRGVYLPFWSFSMLLRCDWDATIGEYWYRTETYTVHVDGKTETRTRTVTETEWWPLAGRFQRYYFGYLVSGSKGLPQAFADRVMPYHLNAAKRYEAYFLAGWLSEEYSTNDDEALRMTQHEFTRRAEADVAAFLPGDLHRNVNCRIAYENNSTDLFLLPVYLLTYEYHGQRYRFVLNGQTGRVFAERPISWVRIALFAAAMIAVGLAIGFAFSLK